MKLAEAWVRSRHGGSASVRWLRRREGRRAACRDMERTVSSAGERGRARFRTSDESEGAS
eukprot:1730330-Pleurochrysis_carterae.AAC.4